MKSSADCTTRCSCCMSETMSWNPKGCCDADHANPSNTVATKLNDRKWTQSQWHNNRAACESAGYKWYMVSHADNLNLGNNSFVCAHTQFSRVNQLGNSRDDSIASQSANASLVGKLAGRDETRRAGRQCEQVPVDCSENPSTAYGTSSRPNTAAADYFSSMTSAYKSCVLRIRYNISTADYQQWPIGAVDSDITQRMVDYKNNSKSEYDPNTPLQQNPYVYIGAGATEYTGDMFVSLRVNTNQYGRTFQDRSYVFSIHPSVRSFVRCLLRTPPETISLTRQLLTSAAFRVLSAAAARFSM